MRGNRSPAKDSEPGLFCDDFKHPFCEGSLLFILREKEHSNAVISFFSKYDSGFLCCLFEEIMTYLEKYTYTVSHLTCGILSGTMLQLFYYMKGIIKNLSVLCTVNVYNGSYSAGIVAELLRVS